MYIGEDGRDETIFCGTIIMEFKMFHKSDTYLPPRSDILLIGTGASVLYNMNMLIKYILRKNPIIIGINGYLHGILSLIGKDIRVTAERPDVDMTLLPQQINDFVTTLRPHVIFSNLLLQGEIHEPGGTHRGRTELKTYTKWSPIRKEPRGRNLFYVFIGKHKKYIKKHQIYINCPSPAKIPETENTAYFGSTKKWAYKRSKTFQILPSDPVLYKRDYSYISEHRYKLHDLYREDGIQFNPIHGGAYYLSWLFQNNIKSLAICGICDQFKQRSDIPIRNWFWQRPARILPKRMIPSQQYIVNLYQEYFADNFVNLNLMDEE